MPIRTPNETLRIESMAYQGAGVARRRSGKTVFVRGAVIGDLVELPAATNAAGRFERYAEFRLLEPSNWRRAAPCPYAALCGGCPWQVLDYSQQLVWKRQFVVDALERIAHIPAPDALVADCVAGPSQWHYRNKLEFAAFVREGKLRLGLRGSDGSHLAVQDCLLLPKLEGSERLPARLAGALGYVFKDDLSQLRRLAVRHSARSGDLEVALWTLPRSVSRQMVARLTQEASRANSVVRLMTTNNSARREVRKLEVLAGPGHWRERLSGFDYRVSAPAFFQVNSAAAELMQQTLLAIAQGCGLSASNQVLDLYSGVGSFTLPLAQTFNTVTAVESVGFSLRDLRWNLRQNRLKALAIGGDVSRELAKLPRAALAVVDPPRSGLRPAALSALLAARPQNLIYVSCDPTTLARDLKGLLADGYRLAAVTPFDLFPQSYHVESLAVLGRF